MKVGNSFTNPKNRGANTNGLPAQMHPDAPNMSASSGSVHSSIDGEMRDMPGQMSYTQLTAEYGAGRHEAYDSPLAQPAYTEHGKVKNF